MQVPGNFLPCGIGSLPFKEPEPALELIFQSMPQIPHWPQLPRRGRIEHFVYQSLAPLVRLGLIVVPEGEKLPYFATQAPDWPERLTQFYTIFLEATSEDPQALESFAIPREAGQGFYALLEFLVHKGTGPALFLKGQVAGPLTAGLYLTDAEGRYAFYDPQLRDLIIKTTAMQARWQAKALGRRGLPVIIFVDDPALSAYGTSTHVALNREEAVEALKQVALEIKKVQGIPGAHSCSGVDWSIFFEAGFQIVSFDAYNYFDSLKVFAPQVENFLAKGGILAWGIVPTYEQAWKETRDTLSARLKHYLDELVKRGVTPKRLYQQALITPSCGTGVLEEDLARRIYQLTAEVSELMATKNKGG
ncbi:hypothetical protein SAMN00808754_1004 [Thermanaeromonas toyohensis ToBE]|uniref:Methionine synthase II (Cobalamin-independent) n=1 Tax=Thermanaeromonas toyohensis ToBE TaxID=698762 RepID=A0A1W1VML8_9FIRM|nr:hypothetical protein [Thermanaeromonas toyohensis]SMB94291.1 hypothetical protein SAMN00808754_1004 [Thermanaeromonas toyohensis ToBE]